MVARTDADDDRRRVDLTLTEKAEALLFELSTAHLTELRRRKDLLKMLLARLE